MAPKVKKPKNGQPPPIDKLIVPAIVVGAAILAYQFIKGMSSGLTRVNVLDELELRDVLFGEGDSKKKYAVLCHKEGTADTPSIPVSSVFQDAHKDGSVPAQFRLLDCDHTLPSSGKTVADRFQLDLKQRPTIFVSGYGLDQPVQIPSAHLKTGDMLAKALKSKLVPRALKIESTNDLKTKCLSQDRCALLLKGAKKAPNHLKDAMSKLLVEFPSITFAAMDSSNLYLKNLEEFLPELRNEQARFVVFQKVSGSLDKNGGRLITSYATFTDAEHTAVTYGTMSNLVGDVIRRNVLPEKIPSLPTIKTRTKKLVEEERQKRQRRAEQQKRKEEKANAPPESSGENDGSKEGRRAERERRREEHRRKNNVREKTPEELAEMERQRRKRMEEEAAKWNMAPEDAHPEDDGDSSFYADDDGEYNDADEDEDEDDEEVIDLD